MLPFLHNLKKNEGFTLVELIVVIAVIGIVSAIIAISVTGVLPGSRDGRRKADLSAIESALENYYTEYKRYPISSGSAGGTMEYSNTGSFLTPLTTNTYLKEKPVDPVNDATYRYAYYPAAVGQPTGGVDRGNYALYARLEKTDATGKNVYCGTATTPCTSTTRYYLVCSSVAMCDWFRVNGGRNWAPTF